MKTLKLSAALLLLGTLTLGVAATTDEQIAAIQTAETPEQRVALVNEFKATLSTLSAQDRATAIDQLRSTMQAEGAQAQTQTRAQERSRIGQMTEEGNMQRNQNMNQNQAGSQAMGGGSNSNIGGNAPHNFMGKK
ncbi:MAG: hypothetical protein AUK54_05000 [Helicobacteraceae bacterium CG2_30_36_10]|nr:MAG: hypothetical protein AUK54_05000 [Helicobacteraceae bacterium CG2_30_36_10]